MSVAGAAVAVLYTVDQGRRDLLAAVDQHGIGGGETQQRRLVRPERHGKCARQMVRDVEALGVGRHRVHPDRLRQSDGPEVARLFDADAHRARTVETVLIARSEERRVGQECVRTCRYRWSPYYKHHTKSNSYNLV